ncbi:MAG: uracil phosphoribosyltransferase [Planctomycetaceae bacterium]|nr:uracil phosphoribosyltransferase [Planctomycetaceae bacterium]
MREQQPNVVIVDHPLVRHHLTLLRSVETTPIQFRAHVRRLASLLAYEATQDLAEESHEVTTPLTTMTGSVVSTTIGLVPILRAGLGMVEPVLDLLPDAQVWHLGLYRDEETAEPVHYYSKLPPGQPVDVALVVDPMLATGGSAIAALDTLKEWGVPQVKLLSIIAAQEGIDAVIESHPETSIHVCAVDAELNANKFIVPGLGDAGDRTFNT